MFAAKDRATEIIGNRFRIVKNGLDEAEVSAFVEGLVSRYNDLLQEVERLRAAIGTDERENSANTPGPGCGEAAREEAELIVVEAERRGEEIIQGRVAVAEQRAWDVVRAAEDDAAALRADARREGGELIAEARRKVETAERQADRMLNEAAAVAESARAVAEEESRKLVAGMRRKADDLARAAISKAEDEGRLIIERATMVAQAEAQRIREEARQMLLASKQLQEMQAAEACRTSPEASPADLSHTPVQTPVRGGGDPTAEDASSTFYEGMVELAICPPIVLDRVVKLHRHLKKTPQIKVMDVRRSDDKGLQMRLHVPKRTPLLEVLKAFPEVKKVAVPRREALPGVPGVPAGDKPSVRKVFVTTRR
jgi:vacuolar-type H+-ATPase subunit H